MSAFTIGSHLLADLMQQGFMRSAYKHGFSTRAEIDDIHERARIYGERRRAGIEQAPFELYPSRPKKRTR